MSTIEPMHRLIPQSNNTLISAHKQPGRNVWDIHSIYPECANSAMEFYHLSKAIKGGVKVTMVPNAMVVIYHDGNPIARIGLTTEDKIHEALYIGCQKMVSGAPITWDDIPLVGKDTK